MRIAVLPMLCGLALAQPKPPSVQTKGACSPIVTGNNNRFTLYCDGITKEQGQQFLNLLNDILRRQLDPKAVMAKLDEIRSHGSPTQGELLPDAKTDPPLPRDCQPPTGAVKVFLGTSVAWVDKFPGVILKMGGDNLLSMKKLGNGISFDARITGRDGRVMTDILDNAFTANPNNTLRRSTPDPSTLEVIDEYGNQALLIRYLNPTSISVLGTFRSSQGRTLRIDESRMTIMPENIVFSSACSGGNGGAQFAF